MCTGGGWRWEGDGVGLANFQEAIGFLRSTGKVFSQPLETCVFFTRFTHVLPGFAHSPSPDLKSPRSEVMHGLRAQTELSLNCGPNRVLTI